ncbi:MAG: MFS transporter, partial [Candidatus Tagabacteria bacterium]
HIYWIQALYGIGYSLRIPGWYGMFTRHIDKGHESYDWSFDSIISGVGSGIAAALGGIIAARLGFDVLFIFIGGLSIVGSAVLIFLYYIVEPDHGSEVKGLDIDGKA